MINKNNSDCIVSLNAVAMGGDADLRTTLFDIVFPYFVTWYDIIQTTH